MMGELFNSSQRMWEEMRKRDGEGERMVLIKTHMHSLSLSFDYRWCREDVHSSLLFLNILVLMSQWEKCNCWKGAIIQNMMIHEISA